VEVFALSSPALVAGTVSLSPLCVPLVPGNLSYASGLRGTPSGGTEPAGRLGLARRRRVRLGHGLFVAGLATVFTVLGAMASVLALIEFVGGIGPAAGWVLTKTGGLTLIMSRMLSVYARLPWLSF